jgi:hypothetical protein
MVEKFYAFIKNGIVEEICLFDSKDEELADRIVTEKGFDNAVWVGEDKPHLYSSYDGNVFAEPTDEYLISIGIINPVEEPTEL